MNRRLRRQSWRTVRCGLVIALAAALTTIASAAETILQNDSIPSPGAGTPLPTFLPGEMVACWFTAPAVGSIVGVQVLWDSTLGGNFPQQEQAIHVYTGGTFPTPGTLQASVLGPVLSDGMINEFRFLDPPTDSMALNVAVSAGETVVVALEFLNQSSGNPFASAPVIDSDGIQSGANSVFVIPGGWADAGPLGVTGDFGIRAIFDPLVVPGDYDGDLDVDSDDYDVWKMKFGGTDMDSLAADGNGNLVVDAADYTVWRDNLGFDANGSGSVLLAHSAAVPEPGTIMLLLTVSLLPGAGLYFRRRRSTTRR